MEINENLTDVTRRSKNTITSCVNLAKSLTILGGIIDLDSKEFSYSLDINRIQHRKIIDDSVILKARDKYLNEIINEEREKFIDESDSYSNSRFRGPNPDYN